MELKLDVETKHFADDFHEGRDGDNDYVYSGDLKDAQQQAYNELSADGLPPGGDAQATRDANKLAEEIAGGSVDLGYIFESPDGGETIYRRKVGESERELISKENWKEYNRNRQGVKIHDTIMSNGIVSFISKQVVQCHLEFKI